MKSRRIAPSILLLLFLCGCRSAPITGRSQLLVLPEQRELSLGAEAYQQVLTTEKLSGNPQFIDLVNRVGGRISAVSGRPDYQWEFRLLASPQQNAFCLPGGKVAVNEGILPVCYNEAGLAVVMSHEIGHALARHGGERISQNYAVEGLKLGLAYVTQNHAQQYRDVVMRGYGAASQYGVILPYSRKHEIEADYIGLILMSKAGYDPHEAPRFWNRFADAHKGPKPPEFASTHPNDQRRAFELAQHLPEALQLYDSAPEKHGLGDLIPWSGSGEVAQATNAELVADSPRRKQRRRVTDERPDNELSSPAEVIPATALIADEMPTSPAPRLVPKTQGWVPSNHRFRGR